MKRILRPGRNCQGIYDVSSGGLLVDGRNYYKVFYDASRRAKTFIFIAGWQFDSEVRLLRGKDVRRMEKDVDMIHYLNSLCEANPDLEIYILAWDYSVVYTLEREWFQKMVFQWKTNDRIYFMFDGKHAVGASHHQKMVVIDDEIAFVGGLDICSDRWDDRRHAPNNPRRVNSDGSGYGPYHDIQAYVKGPVVTEVRDIFLERWKNAGGNTISLPASRAGKPVNIADELPIKGTRVAISRTRAKTVIPKADSIQEIKLLYVDAIRAAEGTIYIENQYFSSQAVYQALVDRMSMKDRTPLQVIMILPQKPKALVEEIALGVTQYRMIRSLRDVAKKEGHHLGIYFPGAGTQDSTMTAVYIHSKLMIIDDRFITVGSANTTNRSMGLDTELNLSWEAIDDTDHNLCAAIRKIRADLLVEHTGLPFWNRRGLKREEGLVEYLTTLTARKDSRLWPINPEEFFDGKEWLKEIDTESLPLDPTEPVIEENIYEMISHDKSGLFSRGIRLLNQFLAERKRET